MKSLLILLGIGIGLILYPAWEWVYQPDCQGSMVLGLQMSLTPAQRDEWLVWADANPAALEDEIRTARKHNHSCFLAGHELAEDWLAQ